MDTKTGYQKVSSYEGKIGEIKKIVLLYSGGLDTSVMLKWIQQTYSAEVIALTLDIGQQGDDLDAVKKKALSCGATKAFVIDAKEEFANEYISKGIKANASYQDNYHLATPLGRPLLAKWAVRIAEQEGADAIAHGSTGKGNDQVRIEAAAMVYNPKIKVIAPVREWKMDRTEEIKYAKENGISVPASIDFPYSNDDNMWGMSWEGGEIEDPGKIPLVEKFLTTYTLPKNAPESEELITLEFEEGLPTKLNGERLTLASLIVRLNKLAGAHGVGPFPLVADRLIGVKSRGVYETPGAEVIIKAHRALEHYVSTRNLNELKETLDIKWGYLCYAAMWNDPVMSAINAFNDEVNGRVKGEVKVRLYKGNATVVAMTSPYALDYASFNESEGLSLNVNASPGFIELYSLQMKLAKQMEKKSGENK